MMNITETIKNENQVNMMHSLPSEKNQRQLDIAARADVNEGIRQGLEDEKNGRLRPAREFFAEFEAKHGISHD